MKGVALLLVFIALFSGLNVAPAVSPPLNRQETNSSSHSAAQSPNNQASSADERVAFYTGLLALFTAALVVVGIGTAGLFICQNVLLRRTLKLANDEFIASHRPKIIVTAFDAKSIVDGTERYLEISFICINGGQSEALVKGISYGIGIGQSARKAPYRGIDSSFAPFKLAPGGNHPVTEKFGVKEDAQRLALYLALNGESGYKVFLRGRVTYDDRRGSQRETGFHRVYAPETEDWLKVKNSDYEYSY